MRLKKFSILLCMLIIFSVVSGCREDSAQNSKVGMITQLNSVPEAGTSYYDNFVSMQMALKSKNIDEMRTYKSVANYMTAQSSDFEMKEGQTVSLVDAFCCAMREEDVDLKNNFDNAITAMKNDGTLDALIKKYITDLKSEPPAVEIKKIEGAETIKVGITGDLPPLDLVLADGTPAGFNTAVLSEISKRIGKNIELVQIDSSARAAALSSKKVDVIFWVTVPQDDKRPADMDKPEGISVTQSYYQDEIVDVSLGQTFSAMQ